MNHDIFYLFTNDGTTRGWNNFGTIRYRLALSKFSQLKAILNGDYDVLVSDGFPTWNCMLEFCTKMFRHKKLIYAVEEWHEPSTPLRKLLAPTAKIIARSCDAVVASGSAAKAHVIDYGVSEDKIFIAPMASWVEVPGDQIPDAVFREKNKFVVLYMGRLTKLKGVDVLLKSFSKLEKDGSHVELLIVGDGPFRGRLNEIARELGLSNVRFMGACDLMTRGYYYSISDVTVLPSIRSPQHCEAWGLTLNEAMQFGKPVITTDAVGASFDLVKDGANGYVVKNGDAEAIYRALKELLSDRGLLHRMGDESKRIVEESFTYERRIMGFENAIAFVEYKRQRRSAGSYGLEKPVANRVCTSDVFQAG